MNKHRHKYLNNSKESEKITPENIRDEAKRLYKIGGEDLAIQYLMSLKRDGLIDDFMIHIPQDGCYLVFTLDNIEYRFCIKQIDMRELFRGEFLDIEFEVEEEWREYAKKRKSFWEEYRRRRGK